MFLILPQSHYFGEQSYHSRSLWLKATYLFNRITEAVLKLREEYPRWGKDKLVVDKLVVDTLDVTTFKFPEQQNKLLRREKVLLLI